MIINKQQTAVEWYFNQSERLIIYYKTKRMSATELDLNLKEIQGIAKEMFQEQIENAYETGKEKGRYDDGIDYYNYKFGDSK